MPFAGVSTRVSPRIASVLCLVALAGTDCRIRPSEPYWIELHGGGVASRVAGWSAGALAIGSDHQLWAYPADYGLPWGAREQTRPLRSIAAGSAVAYGLTSDGQVARFTADRWTPYEGSEAWQVSEIGATDDDQLLVIAAGKLRSFEDGELRPLGCDAIVSVALAGTHGNEAFVLDSAGALYSSAGGGCQKLSAPARLRRIAAKSGRLIAVADDGAVWRRRAATWTRLPEPFKYRVGQAPAPSRAQDVGASAYSTWLVDTESSVFVLSDET